MSKCKQCGEELVWVGSMQDGRLECPNCLAIALWADAGSDDIVDPGFNPDSIMVGTAPDMPNKFSYVNHYKTTVRCPACDRLSIVQLMNASGGGTLECSNCGIWAEVEQ